MAIVPEGSYEPAETVNFETAFNASINSPFLTREAHAQHELS